MILREAVEILTEERKEHHSFSTDIIGQAEQLGIEALKAWKSSRDFTSIHQVPLLPGETEE